MRNEEEAGENMITISDIAKIVGVSHSTVSRSLNDSSEISQKTKERIKKNQLKYIMRCKPR